MFARPISDKQTFDTINFDVVPICILSEYLTEFNYKNTLICHSGK